MSNQVLELYAKLKGIPLKEAEKLKTRADLKKYESLPIERKKELYLESGNTEEDFYSDRGEEPAKKPEVRYRDGGEAVFERRTFTGKSRDFEDIKDSEVYDYLTEKHDQLEAEKSWYRLYGIKGSAIEYLGSAPTQRELGEMRKKLVKQLSDEGYSAIVTVLIGLTLKEYNVGPFSMGIIIAPIVDGKLRQTKALDVH
jgi:hypothetical protein